MKQILTIFLGLTLMTMGCKNDETYPVTKRGDVVENYHGTEVADPYRWLEDPDGADTRVWVEAQNKKTFSYLEKIPFRKKIFDRLEKIWNYPRVGAPFKRGDRYFYYKNDGLQNQSVLFSMQNLKDEGSVLLDPNKFSSEGTKSLTTFSVNKSGSMAVYGTSVGGSDWNEFHLIDVTTGKKMEDHLKWIKFSGAAWAGDGYYYGRFAKPEGNELSSANENKKIYYHKIGTPQSEDKLAYEEPEHPRRGIYAQTTKDERFLILYLSEGATNNNALYVKDLKSGGGLIKLVDRFDFSYDVITNIDDELLILTNQGASRKRIMAVKPAKANEWREVVGEQAEVLLSVHPVGGKLVTEYLKDASSRLYVHNLDGTRETEIKLPGIGTVQGFSGDKDESEAFYTFNSYVYPTTIFRYDIDTDSSSIFRSSKIDFDPSLYVTTQEFFKSADGKRIPMFITHKKGLKKDGSNPTLLYGYGGFNVNILPSFSTSNIALLENGGIYAVATLRGGGEYGEEWHTDGMLNKKQNVFNDFIGAAEHLISEKYTSSAKLAIEGRSNGGLLVGAVMCQRPDLFKVAFPGVGVLDMLRFHKFTIGHAWVVEYGSSDSVGDFENLLAYSPLHNLKAGVSYPATMVFTADHDDRVVPAHSYKFISELQRNHKGQNPVMIRIETMAGHGAGKPTSKIIEEAADKWSFMFDNLGVKPKY